MRVTVRHVASLANVSAITVSRVINNNPNVKPATRKIVEDAMRQLNYHPDRNARSLASAKAHAVGLIIPVGANFIFNNPLYTAVMQGITSFFDQHGYRILLHTPGMGSDYSALFHEKWIDGAILLSVTPEDQGFLRLVDDSFPVVATCQNSEDLGLPTVDIDNTQAAHQATEYLIGTGHRRIVLISGPANLTISRYCTQGYHEALRSANMRFDPSLIVHADFDEAKGYLAMQQLLAQVRDLDAVFALSDVQAIGAMRAISEAGMHVPGDISIIGYDGLDITAYLDPPLTTVSQPARVKGEMAAEMLLSLMRSEDIEKRHLVLPHELKKRGSVIDRRHSQSAYSDIHLL